MEREQVEALILDRLKTCRLFSCCESDYLLPEKILLTVIDAAYLAGQEYANERQFNGVSPL